MEANRHLSVPCLGLRCKVVIRSLSIWFFLQRVDKRHDNDMYNWEVTLEHLVYVRFSFRGALLFTFDAISRQREVAANFVRRPLQCRVSPRRLTAGTITDSNESYY